MADIKSETLAEEFRKKTLGEEAWITVEVDAGEPKMRVRIDYPSQVRRSQWRSLKRDLSLGVDVNEHPDEYFLRSVVKEVENLNVDGKPYELVLLRDMVPRERGGLIDILRHLDFFDWVLLQAWARLYVDEDDKKKLPSEPPSSATGNSDTNRPPSSAQA